MFSLVQYYPLEDRVGHAICLYNHNQNIQAIEDFYDYVNASDFEHNSVVLRFIDRDWKKINIKEEFKKCIGE